MTSDQFFFVVKQLKRVLYTPHSTLCHNCSLLSCTNVNACLEFNFLSLLGKPDILNFELGVSNQGFT